MVGQAAMQIRVLGPIEVIGDGGPINLGGPQQRRILAVLVVAPGQVLTYERLIEVLWPDGDEPDNGRRSAITYVSRLRAALGNDVIETTDAGYVLRPGTANVDAERFTALIDTARTHTPVRALELLDDALSLWRGPVLGNLNGEWWARSFVTKLDELRLTALGERIDALTADGWDGRALAEVTALVDSYPFREQFVQQAMRGQHASGQTADALRTFQRYRAELADQTGLDPSASLIALERSMTTGDAVPPTTSELSRPLRGYVLRELIGEGSFGAVYRATQPGVERDVAVKVIRPELADDRSFVQRFEAEAQLVARLEHPHIVALYDFWRQPGGAFLVFRLMRGGSADELLNRDGPLTIERATALLEQIGSALTAAHTANIVHRDVKPANILFDVDGLAYLADFGIAASVADFASPAVAPQPMPVQRWSAGSALYASPEQLRDGLEDAQADQYALAVTMWELLTGRAPFAGLDSAAVVANKLLEPLGPVEAHRPGFPASMSLVLSRASAVHPSDRYADIETFVAAWNRALSATIAGDTDPATTPASGRSQRGAAATLLDSGITASSVNPYKGLRPFREGDAADFHGRAVAVGLLSRNVANSPFVSVVGPSGSGKSSLVVAGLVPQLRNSGCLVAIMTPGENPFESVIVALNPLATGQGAEFLAQRAISRPLGLDAAFRAVGGTDAIVLVIDQAEELWTLCAEDTRRAFVDGIAGIVASGLARVVVTIRADFFDRPLADPAFGPLVAANTFGITPMTAPELYDAITSPAERIGVRFEASLVSQLVAEAIDQPGSLPLLQFTLAELFERRVGAVITSAIYDELGGLAGSLSRQADELYDAFDAPDRAAVRRMFTRLIAPGEGSEDTRRRVVASRLAGVSDHVVAAFVGRRLLTSDRDRSTREPTLEIAHEVLLRSWPRLRTWLAEDRAWVRELRGLSSAAAFWDQGGRDDADLLRGARLAVVNELATSRTDSLTDLERGFLEQSLGRDAAQQREAIQRLADKTHQNRRLRRSLLGLAVVLVMALIAGTIALVQRQRADRQQRVAIEQTRLAEQQQAIADQQRVEADGQRSIAVDERAAAVDAAALAEQAAHDAERAETASQLTTLASRSLSVRSSQRDLAALLAAEGWMRAPTAAAKSALFGTFTFDPGFLGYIRFDGASGVEGVPVPGSTKMLLTTDPRGDPPNRRLVQVVDLVTGEATLNLGPLIDGWSWYADLAVSGDARIAAVRETPIDASQPPVVAIFDLSNGKRIGPLIELAPDWFQIALDETGSQLAVVAGGTGEAVVYDPYTGTELARIPALDGVPLARFARDGGAVAFGPDGRLYLGSRGDRLRIFDPASFAKVGEIAVPLYATGGQMQFSTDGTTMVGRGVFEDPSAPLGQRGSIARIDLASSRTVWEVSGTDYGYGECAAFAFSIEADRLWCGNYFGVIRERSLSGGGLIGETLENQRGWLTRLDVIAVSDGEMLVGHGNNAGVVSRWRIDGGGPIQRTIAAGHSIVAYLGEGSPMLVGTPNGGPVPLNLTYSMWDSATNQPVHGLPDFLFASAGGDVIFGVFGDGLVGTYDVSTGRRQSFPFSLDPTPSALTASNDGSILVIGYDDGHLVTLDTATGDVIQTMEITRPSMDLNPPVSSIALDQTGSRIYVAGNGLWSFDTATGQQLAYNNDSLLANVRVSAENTIAAASIDGTLELLDPETLASIATLPGARGFIQGMFFSADGSLLLARGNDDTLSLYDIATRSRLGDSFDLPFDNGGSFGLRNDGLEFAVATIDGTAVWDLNPEHWLTAACAIAGRNLTEEEWQTYLGDLGPYRPTCSEYPLLNSED